MSTTVTISLSEELRASVDEQVASGGYASREAYIQDLIRREHLLGDRKQLETDLRDRADERDSVVMDAADVERMRDEFRHRLRQRGQR